MVFPTIKLVIAFAKSDGFQFPFSCHTTSSPCYTIFPPRSFFKEREGKGGRRGERTPNKPTALTTDWFSGAVSVLYVDWRSWVGRLVGFPEEGPEEVERDLEDEGSWRFGGIFKEADGEGGL